MADRVDRSVQANQNQQNNIIKQPETVSIFVYLKLLISILSDVMVLICFVFPS